MIKNDPCSLASMYTLALIPVKSSPLNPPPLYGPAKALRLDCSSSFAFIQTLPVILGSYQPIPIILRNAKRKSPSDTDTRSNPLRLPHVPLKPKPYTTSILKMSIPNEALQKVLIAHTNNLQFKNCPTEAPARTALTTSSSCKKSKPAPWHHSNRSASPKPR